jgi:hypothetical protein
MITYIICEGSFDAQLLKTVLPANLLTDVGVVAGGRVSAVESLARSLVVRRRVPVVIVVDADSVVPELVEQRRKDIEETVESVSINTPVKVVMAVPEMEIIFFQDVSLLSRLLGYIPPQDILDLAVFQPKQALEQLLSQSEIIQDRSQIIDRLAKEDIEILRSSSVMQEIVHFLESVRETASVV